MDKLLTLLKRSSRTVRILIGLLLFYAASKAYKKYRYKQKLFNNTLEIQNKAILITGCDTGFGNATALKLSIDLGFRVIATCLKKESVDKFLSNTAYTKNKSTATVMDVSKLEDIQRVKQFTIKYLQETNSVLWGLVNNAGFSIPGEFELVPAQMDEFERNVLFMGPLNIIRTFLPLLPGRANYKIGSAYKQGNDGGRIVNIASSAARFIMPDTRYGPSKAALSYFSHALRMEVSTRFGIWVCAIEPGTFLTGIVKGSIVWGKRVENKLKEENNAELMDIYKFDISKAEGKVDQMAKDMGFVPNIEPVVNAIVHGLTAKYPQRSYQMGYPLYLTFLCYAPLWLTEAVTIAVTKKKRESL
eukprot:239603_1